ncbi:FAD-dependent oxidoreductase [Anaerobacillus alkaliphilus]|uniref:FAD-dependent oxidoreductase n=1 Tax=Anaerobacillus alkaliphilus TaxID=1548597 RepID=A0A4Q0VT23_9BACI|nr:NAD(P)/FAD-dependent oxidoreductase [Anaerobacillus alkaliphilus]RXJ00666.1 FAD-dependent oxidoreductase [Anaerobacillus alkaliphilus]
MTNSVCVLGAGIGGLMAGAYLAKAGFHVTVIEKARTVGGSAGWYVRKDRIFPTGATIAFGLEDGGLFRKHLDNLGIQVDVLELSYPMDIVLPDREVSIFLDSYKWEQELRSKFSDRKHEVLEFWRKLNEISQVVLEVTRTGVSLPIHRFYDLGGLPMWLMKNPRSFVRLTRYFYWTVEDLMKKYNLENYVPLRQFLDAQLLDAVQTDVSEAALLPSSLALTIYRRGSFYVENGIGTISKKLACMIEELGGEVITSSRVKAVIYNKENKLWDVESAKCKKSFTFLINNTGVSFGAGTSYMEKEEFSWGALRIDTIVNEAACTQPLPFAYQMVVSSTSSLLKELLHGPLYVTFQKSFNKEGTLVSGELVMTASIHTYPDKWVKLSKEEYKKIKQDVMEELLSEIERVIPIKRHLLYVEAGTPVTYQKFVGKGEVGGFPLTVTNAILRPKSFRTKLPNLFIVGEQVFPGPGTLSSALSGYYAARAIIREHQ